MEIQTNRDGDVIVVTLEGEIDGKTAPEAQQQILPMIESDCKVLLDMTKVPYMSSAGLRMMLLIYRQVTANEGTSVLVGLSEEIQDTMESTGFLRFFEVRDDYDAAIELLNS